MSLGLRGTRDPGCSCGFRSVDRIARGRPRIAPEPWDERVGLDDGVRGAQRVRKHVLIHRRCVLGGRPTAQTGMQRQLLADQRNQSDKCGAVVGRNGPDAGRGTTFEHRSDFPKAGQTVPLHGDGLCRENTNRPRVLAGTHELSKDEPRAVSNRATTGNCSRVMAAKRPRARFRTTAVRSVSSKRGSVALAPMAEGREPFRRGPIKGQLADALSMTRSGKPVGGSARSRLLSRRELRSANRQIEPSPRRVDDAEQGGRRPKPQRRRRSFLACFWRIRPVPRGAKTGTIVVDWPLRVGLQMPAGHGPSTLETTVSRRVSSRSGSAHHRLGEGRVVFSRSLDGVAGTDFWGQP